MEDDYNYPPNYYSRYSNETLDTEAKTSKLTELETGDELSGLKNDGTIIYTVVLKELKQGAYIGLYHVKGKTVKVKTEEDKTEEDKTVEVKTVKGELVEGEPVIYEYYIKYYTLEELAKKFANADSIKIIKPYKKSESLNLTKIKPNTAGKIRRNTSSKKLKKRTTLKRRKTKSRK
jgi:hypothetical protein